MTQPLVSIIILNYNAGQILLDCFESVIKTNYDNFEIIISGLGSDKVKEYYENGENFGVNLTYIEQDYPRGIAHAVNLCKDH